MAGMNAILEIQLNLYALKGEVWVTSVPLWKDEYMKCEGFPDLYDALWEFRYWHRDYYPYRADECKQKNLELNIDSCPTYDNHGQWTLLSDCSCEGCGYSYISQLCDYKYNIQAIDYDSGGLTWYSLNHQAVGFSAAISWKGVKVTFNFCRMRTKRRCAVDSSKR